MRKPPTIGRKMTLVLRKVEALIDKSERREEKMRMRRGALIVQRDAMRKVLAAVEAKSETPVS